MMQDKINKINYRLLKSQNNVKGQSVNINPKSL